MLLYCSECLTLPAAGSLRRCSSMVPLAATAEWLPVKPEKMMREAEQEVAASLTAAGDLSLDFAVEGTLPKTIVVLTHSRFLRILLQTVFGKSLVKEWMQRTQCFDVF